MAGLVDGGGSPGIRAWAYLESAVHAPRSGYYVSLARIAAMYAYAITNNHPFVDGNKRAGLITAWLFLAANGFTVLALDRPRWRRTMLGVASGKVTRTSLARRFALEMGGDVRIVEDP